MPDSVVIHIANLDLLAQAYGPPVLAAIRHAVSGRLQACGLQFRELSAESALFLVELEAEAASQSTERAALDQFLEHLRASIECQPVDCGVVHVYLQVILSVFYAPERGGLQEVQEAFPIVDGTATSARTDLLRTDLLRAASLLDALQTGRLALAFQPIVRMDGTTLYHEALLRCTDGAGQNAAHAPGGILALERLGGVSRLDQSVVWTCVQLLALHPDQSLGCNVSADSLQDAAWWRLLMDHLAAHPQTASRLVLEITETGTIPETARAFALVAGLRACGVLIAIDDMGAGHSTLEFLARSHADVVKIDRSLLAHALATPHPCDLLRKLVAACAALCPCVVVEGIETEAELGATRHSCAHGMQGYLIQTPDMHPPWLRLDTATVVDGHTATLHNAPGGVPHGSLWGNSI